VKVIPRSRPSLSAEKVPPGITTRLRSKLTPMLCPPPRPDSVCTYGLKILASGSGENARAVVLRPDLDARSRRHHEQRPSRPPLLETSKSWIGPVSDHKGLVTTISKGFPTDRNGQSTSSQPAQRRSKRYARLPRSGLSAQKEAAGGPRALRNTGRQGLRTTIYRLLERRNAGWSPVPGIGCPASI